MAQGKPQKKTIVKPSTKAKTNAKTKAGGKQSAQAMRKGRVVKAAKKQGLVKQHKLQRKLVAGMTASLEQAMSVKAGAVGKLTIMKEAQTKGKAEESSKKRRKY
ncbi:hypothetical protein H4S06_003784 [Coemansia sp. BCRC 34490]|nr:hypothetical protein LPJ72_006058 [Coemansia sp. Benny D160-2]KAJ2611071.1 hypothetical protein EV177_003667 [Coemansia sp. RSA 1804]KAJ2753210.1 hypothetical protein H4S06_003784 [Coemansia sp. BCRC 34490]